MNQGDKLKLLLNDEQLGGVSSLEQLMREFSADENFAELTRVLRHVKSQVGAQWYPLYKITVVMKYLCEKHPKERPSSLLKETSVVELLANYVYEDNFQRDQGANVRLNARQLLEYLKADESQTQREVLDIFRFTERNINRATERMLQTVDGVDAVNSEKIVKKLRLEAGQLEKYFPGPVTYEKHAGLDKNPQIDGIAYGRLIEKVVANFDDIFPMIDGKLDPIIERFIVVDGSTFAMFRESLIVLCDHLRKSKNPRVLDTLVLLLEKLIKSDSLLSVMTEICSVDERAKIEREETEREWLKTLQLIVSLPNRVANKLDGKVPDAFSPRNYTKILSFHVARTVRFLKSSEKTIDAKMISMLMSKALTNFGCDKFDCLVDAMSAWFLESDNDMRNLVRTILSKIDRSAMEQTAVLFFKRNDPAVNIADAFRDSSTNPHWNHVFTTKIPLMAYYENDNIARNLIAYLSNEHPTSRRLLPNLVVKLLDVWGDRSALSHTCLEQHVYITKLIVMSMRTIGSTLSIDEKNRVKRSLLSGISAHLESTQHEVRAIGMITSEILIEILNDSDDGPTLKYDYEGMPENARRIVAKLGNVEGVVVEKRPAGGEGSFRENGTIFPNGGERKCHQLGIECGILSAKSKILDDSAKIIIETNVDDADDSSAMGDGGRDAAVASDDDLDSDDDLVPCDMSNDTPISEKLRPTYLRDLRDNLLNAKSEVDPNVFSESIKSSEALILSQLPNDDSTFAIELLEILVTLRENSCVEDFELLKFRACVSIVVIYPRESAVYLCKEFHAKLGEYSIQDRLFVLDVLRESAGRLSRIETPGVCRKNDEQRSRTKSRAVGCVSKRISLSIDATNCKKHETLYDDDFEVAPTGDESTIDWREIVGERIKSKTRRFARPTKLLPTTMNRFNEVASSFFFPLLYGFRREGTCMRDTPKTFEDQENIILVNYLKTLSRIMIAAEHCSIVPKMAREMMDLAWTLRYHNQAKVRLCVIESVASVIVTLPKEGLTGDLTESILEFRAWLSDVSADGIRGDPDSDCRNFGKNVVSLIDSAFRSTLDEL